MKNSVLHEELAQAVTDCARRSLERIAASAVLSIAPLAVGLLVLLLLQNRSALAAPLALGTTVSGELSTPGQADQYTFTGIPGMRLAYDALSTDSLSMNARLIDPSGTDVFNINSRSDYGPLVLLDSGTYTLILKGNGPTTGAYSFRLVDLSTAPALPLGAVISKTQTPGSLADYYILNGTAGQNYYFDASGGDNHGGWNLFAPNNQQVPNAGAGIAADFVASLNQTGPYVLAILPFNTAPVSFTARVTLFTVSTNPLTLSGVTSGSISTPGEQKVYTFNGTVGQRLAYDALDTDSVQIYARLITPGGVVLFDRNSRQDYEPLTLPESGTYTLLIYPSGATTGAYNFRLVDLLSQPSVDVDFSTPITKTLTPGAAADFYKVAGNAGDHLYFDAQGANGQATWYLYAPGELNNVQIGSAGIGTDFEVTLPRSGTFILALWGGSTQPVPYTFRVLPEFNPADPLTLGGTVSSSLANPGDLHRYTFTGAVGQPIYYDALNRQFAQIYSKLTGPDGQVIWDFSNASGDQAPIALPAAGLYTLLIDGAAGTAGAFAFRLLDLSTAPALTVGSVTAGQLNPAASTAVYQFNGASGQRLNFKAVSATVNQATWRLVGPAQQAVSGTIGIASDLGDVVLPAAGPYWLLVEGSQDNSAPLGYQFLVTDKSDLPVAATNLGAIRSGTISAGGQDTLTFTAPAGLWVYFDSMDRTANNSGLVAELRDPTNAQLLNVGAGSDAGPLILPHSGTYTFLIHGGNATVSGSFKYRLMNWTGDTPALPLNQTVSASLDPAYKTDVYYFDGQPGQRLVYDGQDTTSDAISVRMFGPDAQVQFLNGSSHGDYGPFTLKQSGRYYIVFESNVAAPAVYTGRLFDLASQPTLTFSAPINAAINPGMAIVAYKFTGTSGQRFTFSGQGATGTGSYYLYGPNNEGINNTSFNGFFELTVQTPGTYALLLYGANSAPFNATIGAFDQTPQNASDLAFTGIQDDLGSALVTWSSSAGKSYRLSYKNNLEEISWTDLAGDVTATGAFAHKEDSTIGNAKRRFYRVQQLP